MITVAIYLMRTGCMKTNMSVSVIIFTSKMGLNFLIKKTIVALVLELILKGAYLPKVGKKERIKKK